MDQLEALKAITSISFLTDAVENGIKQFGTLDALTWIV